MIMKSLRKTILDGRNSVGNALGSWLRPRMGAIGTRCRLAARVRKANAWASRHPRRTFGYVVATLAMILVCDIIVTGARMESKDPDLQTIAKVRRQINPKLQIDGILLTMVDIRTTYAREISALLRETYGSKIKVFATAIPHSVRAAEISAEGKSIFAHDPKGKVATAYHALTQEVMKIEKQREKHQAEYSR